MADETPQVPTEPAQPITNPPTEGENPTEKRIKALSGDVKKFATERDEAILAQQGAEKRAAFAEGFVDIMAQYPAAKDFKTQIQEKVLAGLTPTDATFAVLGAAGKLGGTVAPIAPSGGSAPTALNLPADKPFGDMDRNELRAQLIRAQNEGALGIS